MKQALKLCCAVSLAAGLVACATPQSPDQLSQATVDYRCGPGGQDPLTVQYTFQGGETLAAKVIYQNQVVDLPRSTATHVDMVGNTFRGNGYTWSTEKFNYDTVGTARGEMLTRDIVPSATTSPVPPAASAGEVSNVIVRDCAVAAAPAS